MKKRSVLGMGVALAIGIAAMTASSSASAQDRKSGVVTLGVTEIVGRVQRPLAQVDVSKIQPKLLLAELRQPFLDRIEEAVQHDPF
jgi:hypothetical protein